MALYTIGDLHLSLAAGKPMDVFPGWNNYVERIETQWRQQIGPEDTVVLAGDTSWAMALEDTLTDFTFIHRLPGRKILLKGNHDYWWSTRSKMEHFLQANGLDSLQILHNNSIAVEGIAVCGSRGWLFEQGEAQDQKVLAREAGRLDTSLRAAVPGREKVAFLHYPPLFGEQQSPEILDVLLRHKVTRCYYGHIHGAACNYAFTGRYMGIDFRLISADHLGFCPVLVDTPGDSLEETRI